MFRLLVQVRRSTLPVLIVLCLAALTVSYAFADEAQRPLATQVIGDPDAAVTGKFAVGTATPGNKALTVVGVIDFLGSGAVHNYFTQGPGNNMQINTNVDEANAIGDATKSQWKLVMGSSLDWFSIRRSPAGGTYNEDALFFIDGSTGRVGIATVDTGNMAAIPFTPAAKLHVETASGTAIFGRVTSTFGSAYGVYGRSDSQDGGLGVYGYATATTGNNVGVYGRTDSSTESKGVYGIAAATGGFTYGVVGENWSPSGVGVVGSARAGNGENFGVFGRSDSTSGRGVYGSAPAIAGTTYGVYGQSASTSGTGVFGTASATGGVTSGVTGYTYSTEGFGVVGGAFTSAGANSGVYGQANSTSGRGVVGYAASTTGSNIGVFGSTNSPTGYGVYSLGDVYADGDFAATGTKAAIVETQTYGWRSLYAVESPQNWFEDFGRATLSSGEAVVPIEAVFAQTVNLDEEYHVFLTPLGSACLLYVVDMSPASFTVRANEGDGCQITFDYRIIAPRLDYEDLRLKEAEDPAAVAASLPEVK
jgi:hypothetical protein